MITSEHYRGSTRHRRFQVFVSLFTWYIQRVSSDRSIEWVTRLPAVVVALNGEVIRLTGKKPSEAIKARSVAQKPSSTVPGRTIGLDEPLLPSDALVRYLYAPGELEGGRRQATDPMWSLTTHTVRNVVQRGGHPALY